MSGNRNLRQRLLGGMGIGSSSVPEAQPVTYTEISEENLQELPELKLPEGVTPIKRDVCSLGDKKLLLIQDSAGNFHALDNSGPGGALQWSSFSGPVIGGLGADDIIAGLNAMNLLKALTLAIIIKNFALAHKSSSSETCPDGPEDAWSDGIENTVVIGTTVLELAKPLHRKCKNTLVAVGRSFADLSINKCESSAQMLCFGLWGFVAWQSIAVLSETPSAAHDVFNSMGTSTAVKYVMSLCVLAAVTNLILMAVQGISDRANSRHSAGKLQGQSNFTVGAQVLPSYVTAGRIMPCTFYARTSEDGRNQVARALIKGSKVASAPPEL